MVFLYVSTLQVYYEKKENEDDNLHIVYETIYLLLSIYYTVKSIYTDKLSLPAKRITILIAAISLSPW